MTQDNLETKSESVNVQENPTKELSKLKVIGSAALGITVGGAVGGAIGLVGQFAVPSLAVTLNNQGIEYAIDSVKKSESIYQAVGHVGCYLSELSVMGYVMYEQISSAIQKASEGNYTHLGVLIGTNVVSAGLELFRFGHRMGQRNSEKK